MGKVGVKYRITNKTGMEAKILRTHRLDRQLDIKLNDAAKSANKTRSDIVRDALGQYLNKNQEK